MSNQYEAVVWNDVLGNAFQNLISGKPDCWDTIEKNLSFAEAVNVANKHEGNCAVRVMGEQKYIVRGTNELNVAAGIAQKTGLDNEALIDKFMSVYYGENRWEYLEYV